MRKLTKKLLAVVLVLALVLSLCACGEKAPDPTKSPDGTTPVEKTVIKFANHMAGEAATEGWWKSFEADFEKANPEYDLEYVIAGYNDMFTQVTNMAATGDFVDLMVADLAWVPGLAEAGAIQPMKDVVSTELMDDYYDSLLENYVFDGEIYGAPLYYSNVLLFVNTKLVEEAGLDIDNFPTTEEGLNEWLDALAGLKSAHPDMYPIGLPWKELPTPGIYVNAMITAFGGEVLTADGKLAPANQGFEDAIQYYVDLDKKGYNPQNATPKDMRAMYGSGNLGMFFDTTWGFSGALGVDATAGDWTVTRNIPSMGNGSGETLLQAHSFVMNNNGDAKAAGVDALIKFFETKEYAGEYMTKLNMAFPAVQSLDGIDLGNVLEGAAGGALNVNPQINVPNSPAVQTDLCTLLNAVILNGKSYDQAYAEFAKEAESLLK